jgi:hypothetical protein
MTSRILKTLKNVSLETWIKRNLEPKQILISGSERVSDFVHQIQLAQSMLQWHFIEHVHENLILNEMWHSLIT